MGRLQAERTATCLGRSRPFRHSELMPALQLVGAIAAIGAALFFWILGHRLDLRWLFTEALVMRSERLPVSALETLVEIRKQVAWAIGRPTRDPAGRTPARADR